MGHETHGRRYLRAKTEISSGQDREISLDKSGDIRPQSRTMDRQIKCILVIIPPTGIDICDGMSFTIANASQYPYLLEIVSPIMELTGEIVMDSPQEP